MGCRIWFAAAAVAIVGLAGCQKKAEQTQTAASNTAAPAAQPASPAAPTEPGRPVRKAGLWKQTTHFGQMTQVSTICLDAATDEKLGWEGRSGKSPCQRSEMKPVPGGWEFSSTCKMGAEGQMTYRGTATGDFGSKYRVDIEATTTGASMAQANGDRKFSVEAEWQGPCPANMKPGDVALPGGLKANAMAGG